MLRWTNFIVSTQSPSLPLFLQMSDLLCFVLGARHKTLKYSPWLKSRTFSSTSKDMCAYVFIFICLGTRCSSPSTTLPTSIEINLALEKTRIIRSTVHLAYDVNLAIPTNASRRTCLVRTVLATNRLVGGVIVSAEEGWAWLVLGREGW